MANRRASKNSRKLKSNPLTDQREHRENLLFLRRHAREFLIYLFLTLANLTVFGQMFGHRFINLDDDLYVYDNQIVQMGLTTVGLKWAFTTSFAANWHPLTWLSHMLDCQLYGLSPGMHLLTNLLIHNVNTLLLFVVLSRMTGAIWRSALCRRCLRYIQPTLNLWRGSLNAKMY